MSTLDRHVAEAILGIDTLWGGDVMCPSGTGRFIADSWFSDEPLPAAYTDPSAARVRESGGVSAKSPDREAITAYLNAVDIPGALHGLHEAAKKRGAYVANLAMCFETMWDLAMEILDKGEPVSYRRCVNASTGRDPEPSDPVEKRRRVQELIDAAGYASVQDWRRA